MSDKKSPEDETTPEDVAALLSHTHLNQYKVFTQDRRSGSNNNYTGQDRRRSGASDFPAQSGEPTAVQKPAVAPSRATPEATTLEIVRPQAPRWALLQDLGAESASPAQRGDSLELRVPTFAILSTGGGTGKTTVAATLGRALASTGDNILMIHGALQPSAPLHFGAPVAQPGRLRTFVPPQRNQGTVHMLGHQFDECSLQNEESGAWLIREVNSLQTEVDRCIVEITSPRGQESQIVDLASICLVVLTPDMNSVMALAPFRKLSERLNRPGSRQQQSVHFLINKFDPASAFHAEVRQNLRQQLGTRLLPFCIRRSDAVAEALAAGMTVLDYAPNSEPAEDFRRLAVWAREVTSSQHAKGAV
jgi:cellulose synthase operon protein YhjQ